MTDDPVVGSTDDATVLGTSVERPAAEAAAELNQGVRARPAAEDPAPAPRAEPSRRRRGLPFIPRTGADAATLAVTGAALVAGGTALTRAARRRRR